MAEAGEKADLRRDSAVEGVELEIEAFQECEVGNVGGESAG